MNLHLKADFESGDAARVAPCQVCFYKDGIKLENRARLMRR